MDRTDDTGSLGRMRAELAKHGCIAGRVPPDFTPRRWYATLPRPDRAPMGWIEWLLSLTGIRRRVAHRPPIYRATERAVLVAWCDEVLLSDNPTCAEIAHHARVTGLSDRERCHAQACRRCLAELAASRGPHARR